MRLDNRILMVIEVSIVVGNEDSIVFEGVPVMIGVRPGRQADVPSTRVIYPLVLPKVFFQVSIDIGVTIKTQFSPGHLLMPLCVSSVSHYANH